ncbi:GMP/IMP nucleotidase [Nitrincola alkalisediminis]|uniref:GMP/IMP nucleotidase n=1 Tax=Nitrincola alkalisediminis TaxID=1366656 RepID=UPI0031B5CF87
MSFKNQIDQFILEIGLINRVSVSLMILDWQAIDTVLLDMDGTLLDLHFDSYFWLEFLPMRYAQVHALEPSEAKQWLHERIKQEQGRLSWYCLDYWTEELGLPVAALKHEVAEKIGFRPNVPSFLKALKTSHKRSVIVTNAHPDSLNLKLERTGLASMVDAVISSHEFKVPKEDQAFWHALQEREPFSAPRTLLIDDSLPVLNSAARYGVGYLLSIAQPDSQLPARSVDRFNAIHDFEEVMPTNDPTL